MAESDASTAGTPDEPADRNSKRCGIDRETRARLKATLDLVSPHLDAIVDGYLAAMVDDPHDDRFRDTRARQRDHWQLLLAGRFGRDYFESAEALAEGHVALGLEPDRRADGYMHALAALQSLAARLFRAQPDANRLAAVTAVDRALMFDANLLSALQLEMEREKRRARIDQLVDQFEAVALGVVRSVTADCERMAELTKQAEASMMASWAEAIPVTDPWQRVRAEVANNSAMAAIEEAVTDANLRVGEIGESADSLVNNATLMSELVTALIERIRHVEQRRSDRIAMHQPCRLSVEGVHVEGVVADRSYGGAGLHADGSGLRVGGEGVLQVLNLNRDIRVEVANVTSYRVGLRFREPEEAQRALALIAAAAA